VVIPARHQHGLALKIRDKASAPLPMNPLDRPLLFRVFRGFESLVPLLPYASSASSSLLPRVTIHDGAGTTRKLEGTTMNLPIQFPNDEEVIIEEVARFRALSPADRVRSIRGLLAAGALMMRQSPKAAFLREYTLEQEDRARQAVKEFLARHAG
jgi:hypothetical protein